MATPVPVQQHTTPTSASPPATASPTPRPTSGHGSPSATVRTSCPSPSSAATIAETNGVFSSVPKATRTYSPNSASAPSTRRQAWTCAQSRLTPVTGDTGLLTDRYELTMLQAALRDGTAERHCVFELFTRRLPKGRRYGVVAGTGRLLDALPDFRFDDGRLAGLAGPAWWTRRPAAGCADYRFSGDVSGYPEGEVFLPGSPVLTVRGRSPRPSCWRPWRCASSTTTARSPRQPPGWRRRRRPPVHRDGLPAHPRGVRGGGRPGGLPGRVRLHLQPGGGPPVRRPDRRHGRPRVDPSAREGGRRLPGPGRRPRRRHDPARRHLRHRRRHPDRDRGRGAGPRRGPDRLRRPGRAGPTRPASCWTPSARRTPGSSLSGDLDEFALAALAAAPVDAYGVGTAVVTGSGAPTAGFVYKLVEVEGRSVAKRSEDKSTQGGRKTALRRHRADRHRDRGGRAPAGGALGPRGRPRAAAPDGARRRAARRRDPGRVPRPPAAGADHLALAGSGPVQGRAGDPHYLRGALREPPRPRSTAPPSSPRRRTTTSPGSTRRLPWSSSTCRTTSPTRAVASTCRAASRSCRW